MLESLVTTQYCVARLCTALSLLAHDRLCARRSDTCRSLGVSSRFSATSKCRQAARLVTRAQFFLEPLISADGIDRERKAVDSEHGKNLQSDAWRQQQLWKSLSDPSSRFSRFFTGSLDTLATQPEAAGVNVRDELFAFYEREYSANRMKLCVLGRESIAELEALVRRLFSDVPNKGASGHWSRSKLKCN